MPWVVRLCFLLLESVATNWLVLASSSGITPKAGADGPENAENPGSAAVPENANAVDDALRSPPPQPAPEKNVLFEAVTSLEEQLTALHGALPPRTAFLLFSGHSDPRRMSALAARRAEFQASQNQSQRENGGTPVAAYAGTTTGGGGSVSAVRWNTADDRALEEAVMRARVGLLFIGVKV
jgi:RNA exonuclease 1